MAQRTRQHRLTNLRRSRRLYTTLFWYAIDKHGRYGRKNSCTTIFRKDPVDEEGRKRVERDKTVGKRRRPWLFLETQAVLPLPPTQWYASFISASSVLTPPSALSTHRAPPKLEIVFGLYCFLLRSLLSLRSGNRTISCFYQFSM